MDIKINSLLTLSDKKQYVVVGKIQFESKHYYYIADINDNTNLKICYQENDELVKVNDKELIIKLIPLFSNQVNSAKN